MISRDARRLNPFLTLSTHRSGSRLNCDSASPQLRRPRGSLKRSYVPELTKLKRSRDSREIGLLVSSVLLNFLTSRLALTPIQTLPGC
jgi:hypothetical protein